MIAERHVGELAEGPRRDAGDPGGVALEGQDDQVGHQPEVVLQLPRVRVVVVEARLLGQPFHFRVDGGIPFAFAAVRPRHILWPEEAMTLDVSNELVRFVSNREYALGDTLLVSFVSRETRPWPGIGETAGEIVKVEKVPQSASLVITLKRVVD